MYICYKNYPVCQINEYSSTTLGQTNLKASQTLWIISRAAYKDQAKSCVCRGTLKLLNVRKFPRNVAPTDACSSMYVCIICMYNVHAARQFSYRETRYCITSACSQHSESTTTTLFSYYFCPAVLWCTKRACRYGSCSMRQTVSASHENKRRSRFSNKGTNPIFLLILCSRAPTRVGCTRSIGEH